MLARHFLSKKVRVSNSVLKSNVVGSVVRPIRVSNLFSKQYSIFNRKPNWTSSRGWSRFMRVNMSTNFNSARGFSTTEKPEEKLEPKAEQKFVIFDFSKNKNIL